MPNHSKTEPIEIGLSKLSLIEWIPSSKEKKIVQMLVFKPFVHDVIILLNFQNLLNELDGNIAVVQRDIPKITPFLSEYGDYM